MAGIELSYIDLNSTQEVIIWISVSIAFVSGLIMLYYTFKLYKLRHEPFINKRRPILTLTMNIPISLLLMVERVLNGLSRFKRYNTIDMEKIKILIYYTSVNMFIASISIRYWLLYYDIKYTKANTKNEWIKHINNNYTDSWFIKYRKSFGNTSWCFFRIFIPLCLYMILIPLILNIFLPWSIGAIINLFNEVVLFAFVFISWCITPGFDDEYYIFDENKYLIMLIFCAGVTFGVFIAFDVLSINAFQYWYMLWVIVCLCAFGIAWVPSIWVLKKYRKSERKLIESQKMNKDDVKTVYKAIQNKAILINFMEYLMTEFSMECLLSVIEMVQYKVWFEDNMDTMRSPIGAASTRELMEIDQSMTGTCTIDVPPTVPADSPKDSPKESLKIELPKSTYVSQYMYGISAI